MDKPVTYFEVLKWASSFLEEHNKETAIAEYLLLEYNNWNKTNLLLHFNKEVPREIVNRLKTDLVKVSENYPPQYLIGSCEFYGERFVVSEDTLIPRPETEELVELCLTENDLTKKSVVDIGTGTGVIAVSLKKNRPNWDVSAVDLSSSALEIAKENALQLDTSIDFYLGDALEPVMDETFDIIISNPPYIGEEEWPEMDESVRIHEPKMALFADNKGLAIYEKIAKEATKVLNEKGKIYLEIGYTQGMNVVRIFEEYFPQKVVEVVKDMSGHDRMIKVY
ncbi:MULTISPECIES: peptide chain release factor N(5)-glutamine methyltransferase [Vagococcus]|uniref:peptide chain release factor N(5)-glutamine methyltransferase n=1 Tax=Vagococcus TaxID=2737 RepID=UPI000E513658|nr:MULTISPECIES: peptide chain release factor N(5)-glutamine methyltransferase [Vagococcus]RHH71464.1 peptide chain release factor N(5)-glutamine methyltransferase [Vagococcus sp. AM17-17]